MKFNGMEKSLFNIMNKMSIIEDMYICIISTSKKKKGLHRYIPKVLPLMSLSCGQSMTYFFFFMMLFFSIFPTNTICPF